LEPACSPRSRPVYRPPAPKNRGHLA